MLDIRRHTSDDPIWTATGKEIEEWIWILDIWSGGKADAPAVMRYLMARYRLPSFWAQAIATRYVKDVEEYGATVGD
jgi:hypothetical protein